MAAVLVPTAKIIEFIEFMELASEPYAPRDLRRTKLTCQVCKANKGDPLPDGKVVTVLTCYYAGPGIESMNALLNNIGYLVCEDKTCQDDIDAKIAKFSAACKALGFAGISR